MTDPAISERTLRPPADHHIRQGQAGSFTVDFTSADNALHRITGFKTEHAAQAWIAETKRLASK